LYKLLWVLVNNINSNISIIMSKIYLVRHGQTTNNLNRIFQGQRIDGELTELGVAQMNKVGEFLSRQNLQYVFCSPMKRAVKSCEIIMTKLSKPLNPIIIDSLVEMDFGILDGKNIEKCRELLPEAEPRLLESHYRYFAAYPQGESSKDVFVRVESFAQAIRGLNSNTAVVSHRMIIPMILAAILDLDPQSVLDVLIDNDEIIEVDLDNKEYTIIKV
jgi:alpha-ribazole phosphatase